MGAARVGVITVPASVTRETILAWVVPYRLPTKKTEVQAHVRTPLTAGKVLFPCPVLLSLGGSALLLGQAPTSDSFVWPWFLSCTPLFQAASPESLETGESEVSGSMHLPPQTTPCLLNLV